MRKLENIEMEKLKKKQHTKYSKYRKLILKYFMIENSNTECIGQRTATETTGQNYGQNKKCDHSI